MPIIPPQVVPLLDLYDDLINTAEDTVGAAARIAPAAVREVLCKAGGLASLGAGPLGRFQSPGTPNRTLEDFGGILEAACPLPPPLPQPPGPPFEGGQCPGIDYSIRYEYTEINRFGQVTTQEPIQSPYIAPGPIQGINLFLPRTVQGQDGFGALAIVSGAGSTTLNQVPQSAAILDANIISVVRVDGLPDDCGNPPPPPPGPRPPIDQPPRSPDIPRVDPDGNPLPPIFFEPRVGPIYVGPGGDINVPVVVNIGGPSFNIPVSIPVNVNLPTFAPTISFGGNGGGSRPGQPSEPGPPQGICCPPPPRFTRPGTEEDPDQPPEDQPDDGVIVGVLVETSEASPVASATILGSPVPSLRVPRIATVQFGVGSEEDEYIGPDYQVKQLRQYVAAPTDVPVTRAFVGWEPGWEGSFQYVYAPKNEEPSEEEETEEE